MLSYGIGSAAVLRLVMILLGSELIESWQPILLVFAGLLLVSSYRLLFSSGSEDEEDLNDNSIVKLCRQVPHAACIPCPCLQKVLERWSAAY